MKKECEFTHNALTEELECSKSGFDEYGFAVELCPDYPCKKFKESK